MKSISKIIATALLGSALFVSTALAHVQVQNIPNGDYEHLNAAGLVNNTISVYNTPNGAFFELDGVYSDSANRKDFVYAPYYRAVGKIYNFPTANDPCYFRLQRIYKADTKKDSMGRYISERLRGYTQVYELDCQKVENNPELKISLQDQNNAALSAMFMMDKVDALVLGNHKFNPNRSTPISSELAQYYIWNLNPKVSGIDCNSLQYRLTTHSVGQNNEIPEFQGGQTVTVYKVGGGTEPAYLYHVDYLLRSIWRQDYKTNEIVKIM